MALSEIEKLERRYAENPQGLTFAPLAEVHRKNGDVARALDLLRPGLELHPDYIPASIVLGRCHLDLGDLPAAETAFTHVLALDGENVIGLKALADITERQHRYDEAERWLHTLISIDRSNDDARAQLERIEMARRQANEAAERSVEPAAAEPASEPALAELPPVTVDEEPPPAWVSDPGTDDTADAVPLALEDLEYSSLGADVTAPPPELPGEEPVSDETVEPVEGLIGRDVDQPETGDEFTVETSEDIVLRSSGGHEFQVPDASEELYLGSSTPGLGAESHEHQGDAGREPEPVEPEWIAEPELEPEPVPVSQAPAEPAAEPEQEPVPEPASATAEPVTQPEPEMVVTETMAEVLRKQGHPVEALRVYRELEVRSAGDPERFRERIAELEEQADAEPAPPRRAFTAAQTGGQSVGDFFQGLLAARLPAGEAAPAAHHASAAAGPESGGAPTRPAADALSLSSVFGEQTPPVPPAVPAPGAAGGVSFDEFYTPPGAPAGTRAQRAPDPKNDDLDEFHAWLQNLKR